MTDRQVTDRELSEEIQALVQSALGEDGAASPLGRLQVRISGESGGALHDPEEVLRQVAALVLGGLEIAGQDGARRRVSFDGGQLARAFADTHLLEFMKVEIAYVILGDLGEYIFARTEAETAAADVRDAIASLQMMAEGHLGNHLNTLGSRTQQKILELLREALGEESERRLIRMEQDDRRTKKSLIRDLTRRTLLAFAEGMAEFEKHRARYQAVAEQGFEAAASLPAFNVILERNLRTVFDLVWAMQFKSAIESCLQEYEARRALSGFEALRTLDYAQQRVIPHACTAFVGMLMGTYKPRARFVRGADRVAARVTIDHPPVNPR